VIGRRRPVAALLVCVGSTSTFAGCGAPSDRPVVDTSLPEPDSASRRPALPASESALSSDPFSVPVPRDAVCVLAGTDRRQIPLRLSPSGEVFGRVQGSNALRAHLSKGPATRGIVVEADSKSVRVRAFAAAEDLPLHPNRVSLFGGMVVPTHFADLRVVDARTEQVELALDLPDVVDRSAGRRVTSSLPCSVLSIAPEPFDPFENLFGAPTGYGRLRGARIVISREQRGGSDVTLVPSPDTRRDVAIVGQDNQRYRIAWEVEDVIVFGWVDAKDLDLGTPKPDPPFRIGLGDGATRGPCCEHIFLCPDEIPLVAASRDEQNGTVAMLAPGTRIPVPRTAGDRFGVELTGTNLESGNLFVDKSRVAHCRDLVVR
jgi:hypothetical protein